MKFSSSLQLSPIRDLQELCQSNGLQLQFLKSKTNRMFSVEAQVTAKDVSETASATSISQKEAARIASQVVFSKLKVTVRNHYSMLLYISPHHCQKS